MNSRKKILVLGLSLAMAASMLTACGDNKEVKETTMAVETTLEEETTTAEAPVVLNPDGAEVVLHLNDEVNASYGTLCLSILQQKEYLERMTLDYYNTNVTPEFWNTPMVSGKSPAEDLIEQTTKDMIEKMVVASKAGEYQVSLSDEEMAVLKEENSAFYSTVSRDWLETTGLMEEDWLDFGKWTKLYEKVKAAELENYTVEITDDEARTMRAGMFAIALDAANPGKGLPTQEEAEAKIQEIFALIADGAKPQSVVEEYGFVYYEESIYVGQYTDENSLKMLELKTGENMHFVSNGTAVCAVICLDEADPVLTEERKAVLQEEAANKYFDSLVEEWMAATSIEKNDDLIGKMDLFSE